ncbi:hypothetical protein Lsan_2574 [Legionella santicrucis]|uniref:Superinfection immunity protein n=1 Tax=Legionella santicrucis TaxID=45074 RepID=A0A0W0YL24_9GAMM|nr:superinfection immunity protein [Legionella santicrucis]KTD57391.1 hypothetical protein Lsan_2574 [Legionella santicrucis]
MLKQNRLLLRLVIIWIIICFAGLSFLINSYGLYDLDTIIFGFILALLPLYFLPTLVAIKKSHPSILAITVLNLLTGSFFFGWVASLVWALSNPNKTIIVKNISHGFRE